MTDVTAHAQVSQKTVSQVVNGEPYVREEVRLRVQSSIQELGFRPNAAARSLVTRRTRRIGVVALGTAFHGPTSTLAALESVAHTEGYSLSIRRTDSTERDEIQSAVDTLLDEGVEGIVLSEQKRFVSDPLAVRGDVAVLTLGARGLTPREDELVVGADEESGGRLAADRLLNLEHQTVHHIAGPSTWISTQLREGGWSAALREHGATAPEVASGDWDPRSGYKAISQFLESAVLPTAVFVANDQMAIGAISPDLRTSGQTVSTATNGAGEQVHVIHNWSWEPSVFVPPAAARDGVSGEVLASGTELKLGAWDVRVMVEMG